MRIINTCTIDYFFLAFWFAYKSSDNCKNLIEEYKTTNQFFSNLKNLIDLYDIEEFNRVKTIWLLLFANEIPTDSCFNLFGNQYDKILKHILPIQTVEYFCEKCNKKVNSLTEFILNRAEFTNELYASFETSHVCGDCNCILTAKFEHKPPFIFVEVLFPIILADISLSYRINDIEYKFLCCTSFDQDRKHFISMFNFNDSFYLVDDLRNQFTNKIPDNFLPNTLFYYLS